MKKFLSTKNDHQEYIFIGKAVRVSSGEAVVEAAGIGVLTVDSLTDEPAKSSITELLRLAKAGDLGAFEQIMRLHERRVLRTALRLVHRPEDAQDAAQEVFLRLHRHIRKLDDNRDVTPWLYRVTVNVCHDLNRKRQGSATVSLEAIVGVGREPPASEPSPYQRAADAEEWRIMSRALAALPAGQRQALVLRDLEGLPASEVAEILGTSEVTVRTQVCRARLRLKQVRERLMGGKK